jgi:hypothetical protein
MVLLNSAHIGARELVAFTRSGRYGRKSYSFALYAQSSAATRVERLSSFPPRNSLDVITSSTAGAERGGRAGRPRALSQTPFESSRGKKKGLVFSVYLLLSGSQFCVASTQRRSAFSASSAPFGRLSFSPIHALCARARASERANDVSASAEAASLMREHLISVPLIRTSFAD